MTTAFFVSLILCFVVSSNITVAQAELLPDLVATSLNAPASASTQESIDVSWTITNQGEGLAQPSLGSGAPDRFYLSQDEVLDNSDVDLGWYGYRLELAPGASVTSNVKINVPQVAAGNYYLLFKVDQPNIIYESNEDNNLIAKPITIKLPDLIVTSLNAPASASTQESIDVSWTITNQGEGLAQPSLGSGAPDRFYLSQDEVLDNSDVDLGWYGYRLELAPGASVTSNVKINVPQVAAGNYYLLFKVDQPNIIYESNEDNNIFVQLIKIGAPDLVVTAFNTPASVSTQEIVQVSWIVQNQGEVTARVSSWNDRIYLSTDTQIDNSDINIASFQHLEPLDPEVSYTSTKNVDIPSNLTIGNYYLLVKTDADNGIFESREWNNVFPHLITIGKEGGLSETHSTESNLVEDLLSQKANLNSATVTGDLTGSLDFTDLEIVNVNSGVFKDKGFSKGSWSATLEGISYHGEWQGIFYLVSSENKIYLKGTVSGGEASGIVEGYLTESVEGSGTYDQYHATRKLNRLADKSISATLTIDGILSYTGSNAYPATKLYVLQTAFSGITLGHYTESLNSVLTHLRVADEDSLYNGFGFSIISYVSKSGSGEGWTYDKEVSLGKVEMKGLFTSSLLGIVSGDLDETKTPRTLSISIERVDLALPPAPDLKVKVWGPQRVSPGQTVDYIIEYRNDGVKSAIDLALIDSVPLLTHFISASPLGTYDDILHIVRYDFKDIPAKTVKHLSLKVEIFWGLPIGTSLIHEVNHYPKEKADIIFHHDSSQLTDEAQILLNVILVAATTPLPSPLAGLINLGVALPDMALYETITIVEKWRLEAIDRCPRDPSSCNAENYFAAVRGILKGLQDDPSHFKTRYPDKTFEEVIKEFANRENYFPPQGTSFIQPARDPNELLVSPEGDVSPGDTLNYTINYENEGEGDAYGVYITDTLEEDLDDSMLVVNDGGKYDPATRTITWFIGELLSKQTGSVTFVVNVKSDAQDGSEVINFATVYFPSVPETTRTNGTVNMVTTSIDNVPPTTLLSATPLANDAGWNNSDVTIHLTATDNEGGSGVKEIHYNLTGTQTEEFTISFDAAQLSISAEGATNLIYWAVDNLGNIESQKSLEIKIDKTPPAITSATSPKPNSYGWNNTDVTVTFTATDALSGVASITQPITSTTEGANQYIGSEAIDLAGNRATTFVTLNIDKTLPTVNITVNPDTLWPSNNKMVDITIGGSAEDSLSNIASTIFTVDDEYNKVEPAIAGFGSVIQLEASRKGSDKDGRVYTISVTTKDRANNQISASTTVICPHDQGKKGKKREWR
jgi:uncharacterized repeat protein (TIGR01451 family)